MYKKITAALLLSVMCFFSFGCHGNYALFRKLNTWNGTLGNKWVNSVVHIILWIIPVYGICLIVDFLVLNTVQFWTGSNPLAMAEGEKEVQIVNNEGTTYEITATRNRFDVKGIEGVKAGVQTSLIFDEESLTWFVEGNGERVELSKIDSMKPELMHVNMPDGTQVTVNVNEQM